MSGSDRWRKIKQKYEGLSRPFRKEEEKPIARKVDFTPEEMEEKEKQKDKISQKYHISKEYLK